MTSRYLQPVLDWYARHARDLPWRAPGATPWSVLVSEIMLQQTPVARVLPALRRGSPGGRPRPRWRPSPLARRSGSGAGSAIPGVRSGCTRRRGSWPTSTAGRCPRPRGAAGAAGDRRYTAAAVASFAFGQRHAVLDTNVRRVLAGWSPGRSARAAPVGGRTAAGRIAAARRAAVAARWSVAVMELGALVCTAASPRCGACPVAAHCAWLAAGRPAEPPRRPAPGQRTRALTGNAGDACSPCCATPAARWRRASSRRSGPARRSWPGPWTAWSPTAWSTPEQTAVRAAGLEHDRRPGRSRA